MKKLFIILALVLAAGCDDKEIIIVKDGIFNQIGFLTNNGLVVHHMGLDTLKVSLLQHYAGAINFTDAATVVIDIGRTDEKEGTTLASYNKLYTDFLNSLADYEGRRVVCVKRSEVYVPPCPDVITPDQLNALYASLF